MIWFNVTDIDSYLYQMGLEEPPTMEELRVALFDRGPPPESALAGRALHSALEHAKPGTYDEIMHDRHVFFAREGVTHNIILPGSRELRCSKVYDVDGAKVRISGRVDGIRGLTVYDHKTSGYALDVESRWSTYQWRFYLDMLEAQEFVWQEFHLKDPPRVSVFDGTPGAYLIDAVELHSQYAYNGMQADIGAILREFVGVCRHLVPERFM